MTRLDKNLAPFWQPTTRKQIVTCNVYFPALEHNFLRFWLAYGLLVPVVIGQSKSESWFALNPSWLWLVYLPTRYFFSQSEEVQKRNLTRVFPRSALSKRTSKTFQLRDLFSSLLFLRLLVENSSMWAVVSPTKKQKRKTLYILQIHFTFYRSVCRAVKFF